MQIELKKVSYRDKTPCGLGNVSSVELSIEQGEFVCLMGQSDCGRAALAALIAGVVTPEEGSVLIDGKEVRSPGHSGRVGYVMREPEQLFFRSTVEKEVAVDLTRLKFGAAEKTEAVRRSLELVGLEYEQYAAQSPYSLTKGEKRRVALAGVLASFPDILVLDEPMSGMDDLWRDGLMRLLVKLNKDGMTVILLSDDSDRLAENVQRVIVMKDGKAVRDDSARHIFSEYFDLLHFGIDAATVRRCVQLLRENGVDMPDNVAVYDQFIDRLKILLWRKHG